MNRPPLSHYAYAVMIDGVPPLAARAGLAVASGAFVVCCFPTIALLAGLMWVDERRADKEKANA